MTRTLQALAWLTAAACFGAAYLPYPCLAWFPWLGLAPLIWVGWCRGPVTGFLLAWLYGSIAWGVGMRWIPETISRFMTLSGPGVYALYAATAAYHGLAFGAMALAASLLPPQRLGPWKAWLGAVSGVVAVDAFFPELFPWFLATGQVAYPALAQTAALGGAGALAWVMAGLNAGLALAALPGTDATRARPLIASAMVLAGLWAVGAVRVARISGAEQRADGPSLEIVALQGAMPGAHGKEPESFTGDLAGHIRLMNEALNSGPADLVIWPESSFPGRVTLERDGPKVRGEAWEEWAARELGSGPPILLSAISERAGPKPGSAMRRRNTALMLDARRLVTGWVDKRHLIPFGEFMPYRKWAPWLERLSPGTWDLWRGKGAGILSGPGGATLGVLICYEDLVPGRAGGQAAQGAAALINLTNNAWFTPEGREAHLLFSRLRTVETGLPLIRSANGGVTAFIDPAGQVSTRLGAVGAGWLRRKVLLGGRPAPAVKVGTLFYEIGAAVLGLLLAEALLRALLGAGRRTGQGQ